MATRFVNVDRNTPLLLPPDLRDWVPDEDMVHFVIEAVTEMNLPTLKVNRRGSIAIMREIGVETGGSNVHFAINPENGEMVVIEMNPRVSR